MKNTVLILVLIFQLSSGKIFTRCELAWELLNRGIPRGELATWVCIAEAESSFNTAVRGGPNTDGSFDWGLFQINDRFWCTPGFPGKICNVNCQNLLTDDITQSVICARTILRIQGFSAWVGWTNRCQGAIPSVNNCGIF